MQITIQNAGKLDTPVNTNPVVIGVTGASGSVLALSTVDLLLAKNQPVILTISPAARMVWQEEINYSFGEALERWSESQHFTFYPIGDLRSPIASGTYSTKGMAVVPCSMTTIAAIANGLSDNLLRRSADVCLKEKRPLVLVPRETPLNAIHLENMTKLAQLGVTILPPHPPFYLKPSSLLDVVDYIAHRILLSLNISECLPEPMQYTGPSTI